MNGRKNAMLTTEDRRWLTGEKSYEGEHAKQQRYQRRRDIRDRIHSSILDFTILFEHLEDAERTKLFADLDESETGSDREAFVDGLRDALAFIFHGTGLTESMVRDGTGGHETLAEALLDEAVYRAGKRDDVLVEAVELTIDAREASIDAIMDDLHAGKEVSPAGLRLLMESGTVYTTLVQACVRDAMFEDERAPSNQQE